MGNIVIKKLPQKRKPKPKRIAPASAEPIDRPLTAAEKLDAFRTATRSFAAWYAKQIAAGMTDAELDAALQHSLGIMGGSSGPDSLSVEYQGSGLRIWGSWIIKNNRKEPPLFSGRMTIATAREVYRIGNPEDHQMRLI